MQKSKLAVRPALLLAISVLSAASLQAVPNARQVMQKLVADDRDMAHGAYSYTETTLGLDPRMDRTTTGTISYTTDGRYRRKVTDLWRPIPPPDYSSLEHLSRKDQEQARKIGNNKDLDELWDGHNTYLITKAVNQVLITRPKGLALSPLYSLCPGPCLFMGRGLAKLSGVRVTVDAQGVHAQGNAEDGTRITADLDPTHDFVAKSIKRWNRQGRLVAAYTLSPPIMPACGPAVSPHCAYQGINYIGRVDFKDDTSIHNVDFSPQPPELFHFNLGRAGLQISDNRLGGNALLIPKDNSPLSADQVLEHSRWFLKDQARMSAENAEFERNLRMRQLGIVALWVAIFIAAGLLVVVLARRRRRAAA